MKGTSDGNINKAPTPGPWITGFKCVMAHFQKACVRVCVCAPVLVAAEKEKEIELGNINYMLREFLVNKQHYQRYTVVSLKPGEA